MKRCGCSKPKKCLVKSIPETTSARLPHKYPPFRFSGDTVSEDDMQPIAGMQLTKRAQRLYHMAKAFARVGRDLTASNAYLCEQLWCSDRTVSRCIAQLVAHKLVVVYGGDCHRVIRTTESDGRSQADAIRRRTRADIPRLLRQKLADIREAEEPKAEMPKTLKATPLGEPGFPKPKPGSPRVESGLTGISADTKRTTPAPEPRGRAVWDRGATPPVRDVRPATFPTPERTMPAKPPSVPPVASDGTIPFPSSPHDSRPRCRTEAADNARAAKLRAFAVRQRWAVCRSPRKWAEPLALLRRSLAGGDAQIDAVLDWYIAAYHPGMRPTIRNGHEFRNCWDWLCRLYAAKTESAVPPPSGKSVSTPPDARLSDEATKDCSEVREILAELREWDWPRGSAAALPAAVRRSYAAFVMLRTKIFAAKLDAPYSAWRNELREAALPPAAVAYFTKWWRDVWNSVLRWEDWSGSFEPFVWHPGHRRFLQAAVAALEGYSSRATWDVFMKEVERGT